MKKFSFFFLSISLFFFLALISSFSSFFLSLSYFSVPLLFLNNYWFSFSHDFYSSMFLVMVCLVTCFVCFYSETYMEYYNNKKFFFLLFLFFLTMTLLIFSGSFLVLMIGWDGLGISSICLIMFYPNKMTLSNSFLTMFFNRIGDVFLIMVLSLQIMEYSFSFFMSNLSFVSMAFLVLCSFSKSAQFPLSCWLPAAMSAPTPISAMVHSSTLVTAGLFLVHKISYFFLVSNLLELVLFFSLLTFILGGFMASLELDFKKMIAFSTMSQISMIMVFCSLNLIFLSLSHMSFHAFFKTLLFCSSGMMFVSLYSDQSKLKISSNSFNNLIFFSMFLSVFSMTGLIFSSSFFSKDLIIEFFFSFDNFLVSFFLVTGSLLTLFYCSKLMFSCNFFFNKNTNFFYKSSFFVPSFFFCLLTFLSGISLTDIFFLDFVPLISFMDLFLINILFLLPILKDFFFKGDIFFYLASTVSFMTFFSFSIYSRLFKLSLFEISLSDHLFFKTSYFYLNELKPSINTSSFTLMSYLIIFFSLFLLG